jgi:hydroxypyruvate reductase
MSDLKQLARRIFHETLAAIDIPAVMQRKLECSASLLRCGDATIDLHAFTEVRVVAIGKAAHAMVDGLKAVLEADIGFVGIVVAPTPPKQVVKGTTYFVGGHPTPNSASWDAGEVILQFLKECDEKKLVIFLLSGGGSALVELPLDRDQSLADLQQLYRTLVTCGASIGEIGIVRRHLSAVKGGRLAVAAGLATKVSLAVSDVPMGQESALASGPTIPDPSTVADVEHIMTKYALREKLPASLRRWIDAGKMPETPKKGDAAFANAYFSLLLGMDDLFHPAHHCAEAHGFIACCDNATDDWPVEKAAEYLLAQLAKVQAENPGQCVALIADGEVSSPVTGDGIGGRNSAFVLACAEKIAGRKIAVLSAGTDGIDGNSPGAGAVVDGETLSRAQELGIDPREAFRKSDAFTFFDKLGDAIVTGPTGNNLRDLRILLAEPE